MLRHLQQICSVYIPTTNEWGDVVLDNGVAETCRIREISRLNRQSNKEEVDADAMGWFHPDSVVIEGAVIAYQSTYYRVTEVTQARRMSGDPVVFIKTLLSRFEYDAEIS